ncbi:MAG TPA: ATP-binding protein [Kiritimatiellia bacterium]|nr:ATP-binding protein [Kiritimatiellia bacterium]HMO99748.1 ATP-binding protein [Kiritimatiellia bacterium]HMP00019.1 ATP-binding protein [Kiritimatiellia bacterium]HMP97317.1 ATP-binding protein [Kiritimatiellia bacterium]
MAAAKGHELIPSAKRLIRSLRDMGYDFPQAVADVVDNSIEARSTVVAIDVEFEGDDSWVRIADNGRGMKPERLREAMRYGADREYAKNDLGKFGLGLKTASMSQCQRLSVASRWNRKRSDITAYTWDLEHIEKTNRWEIIPIERNGIGPAIRHPLRDSIGTVVLWQRLDRILGYRHPYGENARKRLSQMCRELEQHLGMVFQRFLLGEEPGKRLKILLNGNEVRPWDAFCRTEPKTKKLHEIRLPLEYEGTHGEVLIQPFVLPHQDDFSSPEAFRSASGPANWNQQQGFYIFRAGRMIQSGGWSNLRAPDEHTKLARIAISFSPSLDEAFKINVAKMRVQLPAQIRDTIRDAIIPVIKLAREVYDRKTPKSALPKTPSQSPEVTPDNLVSPQPFSDSPPVTSMRISHASPELLTFDDWTARVLAAAKPRERGIVEAVVARIKKQ